MSVLFMRRAIICIRGHIGMRGVLFVVNYDAIAYRYARGEYEYEESNTDTADVVCDNPTTSGCSNKRTPLDLPLIRRNWIDAEYTDESINPKVCHRSRRDLLLD